MTYFGLFEAPQYCAQYNNRSQISFALTDLAQSRLLGNIRNMKRLVEALPGAVNRHRAHSTAIPTHTHVTTHKEAANHTHRTRTTRVPESTPIA